MGKGSRSRNRSSERDTQISLTPRVARVVPLTPAVAQLRLIQDLRTFYPQPALRPAFRLDGARASLTVARPASRSTARTKSLLPSAVGFHQPQQVLVCVRRKRRKEVLHALRKVGRGFGRRKKHFNKWSNVRC